MVPKPLTHGMLLVCGVLALASLAATADEKKDDKPALTGTWGKKDGETKLEFADKHVLKIAPHGDPAVIAVVCEYTLAKDGLVKSKVTGFEGTEKAKKHVGDLVPVGTEFSFTWQVKGDTAKLDDLKGEKLDPFKFHLEGEYASKP
jgi:hypothetical protein